MYSTILTQSVILTLDVTVTLLLWLSYRNLRLSYLALATVTGLLEVARQGVDTFLALGVDALALFHLSSVLQFSSTLVFLAAVLRFQKDARPHTRLFASLVLLFVSIYGIQQLTGFGSTTPEWYVFYLPLIVTQALIVWSAWPLDQQWPLSRVSLMLAGVMLLIIRSWIPAHMKPAC